MFNDIIKEQEENWEQYFEECENGYAILQLDSDSKICRDVRFEPYETAKLYAGREVERSDYMMLIAYKLENDLFDKFVDEKCRFGKYTSLCDFVYAEFNQDNRPGIKDGYYGTSLSVSDIILIKEKETIHAFYVDNFGFKELMDFEPFKFKSPKKRKERIENQLCK